MRQSPPMPAAAGPAQSSPSPRQQAELATLRRRFASLIYEALLLLGVLGLTFMVPPPLRHRIWDECLAAVSTQ